MIRERNILERKIPGAGNGESTGHQQIQSGWEGMQWLIGGREAQEP